MCNVQKDIIFISKIFCAWTIDFADGKGIEDQYRHPEKDQAICASEQIEAEWRGLTDCPAPKEKKPKKKRKKKKDASDSYKKRFMELKMRLLHLHEEVNEFDRFEPKPPKEPISASNQFFIRNDLADCVDNEIAAKKLWGRRGYFLAEVKGFTQ